jgi:uncharacterized membrane protein YGL010W
MRILRFFAANCIWPQKGTKYAKKDSIFVPIVDLVKSVFFYHAKAQRRKEKLISATNFHRLARILFSIFYFRLQLFPWSLRLSKNRLPLYIIHVEIEKDK